MVYLKTVEVFQIVWHQMVGLSVMNQRGCSAIYWRRGGEARNIRPWGRRPNRVLKLGPSKLRSRGTEILREEYMHMWQTRNVGIVRNYEVVSSTCYVVEIFNHHLEIKELRHQVALWVSGVFLSTSFCKACLF